MANLDWQMLPWQLSVWNDSARFKVLACGRRTGKSNLAIKMLLAKALEAPEGSAVVYVAPTLGQARQICWDALLEQGKDVIKAAHVNQMDVTLVTGRKIHIRSGENPDALRGLKLYFAVIDEASFVKEEIFTKIIRPALADLKGEAVIVSTPDGRNHFYDWFKLGQEGTNPEWKSWHFTTADNPTIPPEEIEEARKTLSSFVFKQEFEANFNNAGQEIFKEEWLKKGKEPQYGSYVIAIDLAGFEEVGKNPGAVKSRLDESAIAIVKVTDEGEWWVKEIIHGRWDIKETAAKIIVAIKDHQPIAVGIERGALKNAVLPFLNDLMRKTNTYAHISDLTHGNKRKQDRIAWALQGRLEHGRISFNEDEDWREAWDQISMFPTAGLHDDLVDALSYVDQMAISNYNHDYDQDEFEVFDDLIGY
jgi:hypothetical protein